MSVNRVRANRIGALRWGKSQLIAIACVTAVAIPAVSQTLQKKSEPVAVPSETIRIADRNQVNQKLEVTNSRFSYSVFDNCRAEGVKFNNVAMPSLSFTDANLSDLVIHGAQLGGASFRHIGLPPKGHPAYVEGARQRPLRFEECDLQGSTIKNSDLKGVAISGCTTQGMTIDGVPVEALLAAYREKNRETK